MPIVFNESAGTISGISVGGLPDGIVDTDMLAAGAVTAAKRGTGSILQVQQTVKTSFQSLATKDVVTDVTSVAITPLSTSSKILVMVCGERSESNGNTFGMLFISRLLSGSTTDLTIGDSRGSSIRCSMSAMKLSSGSSIITAPFGIQFLDSPSTTSECTYKLRMVNAHDGTMSIGGTHVTDDDNRTSVPTIITVMEVAG